MKAYIWSHCNVAFSSGLDMTTAIFIFILNSFIQLFVYVCSSGWRSENNLLESDLFSYSGIELELVGSEARSFTRLTDCRPLPSLLQSSRVSAGSLACDSRELQPADIPLCRDYRGSLSERSGPVARHRSSGGLPIPEAV